MDKISRLTNPCEECIVEASCVNPCNLHVNHIECISFGHTFRCLDRRLFSLLVRKYNNDFFNLYDSCGTPISMEIKRGTIVKFHKGNRNGLKFPMGEKRKAVHDLWNAR